MNFSIKNITRANIKKVSPYSSARDEFKDFTKEMVFLDANENPFENGVNRYPDPQQILVKKELVKLKGVSTNQLLLGNGSDEVLDLLFRAFCEPKEDNILTLPPTYGMYKVLAEINNVENREVLLTENFQPNVTAILDSVDKNSKLLFLCSPNNPTGNSFTAKEVEKLLNSFKGIVVIDEAYIDFSSQKSWLQRLSEFPNLVITQTLSKAYGMAGIRLGICYASSEIISILNKIKPPYNINELTQQRAIDRLVKPLEIKNQITTILNQRTFLLNALKAISFIEKIYPTDANFVLVKVPDATKIYHQLLQQGVVVRNRTSQPLCENTLRLTVGSEQENTKLINALKTI